MQTTGKWHYKIMPRVLLWCSGLRVLCCHCSDLGHRCGKRSRSLAWGLSHAVGEAKKKKAELFPRTVELVYVALMVHSLSFFHLLLLVTVKVFKFLPV